MPAPTHPWLLPLPLTGGGSLPDRILPGPMEGVTHGSFCHVLSGRGLVRCWITPFIRVSTGVPRVARLRRKLAPYLSTGLPVVVQIMGTDIDRLCRTATRLLHVGAVGIDLNCACPSPTVVRNGAGGRRLQHPGWIRDALTALRAVCEKAGLSVKLRTGFSDPAEMHGILAAAAAAGPDYIVLHHRTVAEGYGRIPDGWHRLGEAVRRHPSLAIVASGDLFTVADCLALADLARPAGVAPARGLLRDPWLLRSLAAACAGRDAVPPSWHGRFELLHSIASHAEPTARDGRGFVLKLVGGMLGRKSPLFTQLAHCPSLADQCALLAEWREEPPAEASLR